MAQFVESNRAVCALEREREHIHKGSVGVRGYLEWPLIGLVVVILQQCGAVARAALLECGCGLFLLLRLLLLLSDNDRRRRRIGRRGEDGM